MFLVDWIYKALFSLGLYNKKAKLLFVGLEFSGKTSLLQLLRYGRITPNNPTWHVQHDELIIGNITFSTYDCGGHVQTRRLWREYFPVVSAVVFMVDASRPDRFQEAKVELDGMLSMEEMKDIPFLVFGNKIDAEGAVSEDILRESMGLTFTTGKTGSSRSIRPIEVFMCSVIQRQGYGEGFRWLSKFID